MLISLEFIPSLLKDNEKLQTVNEIESFTEMAHDDAKILFVFAKTSNISITLTKNVKKEDFVQMDKHPTNCITIDEVGLTENSTKRNESYEELIKDMNEEIATLKEKLKTEQECNSAQNIEAYKNKAFEWEDKYKRLLKQVNSHSKEPTDTEAKVKPLTRTIFGKPIVLLPTSEYNQMIVKLKEHDKLKDASNKAEEKYKKQIEALQKYEYRYKDLRSSLETALTQFKL